MTDYVWRYLTRVNNVDHVQVDLILGQRGGGCDLLEVNLSLGGLAAEGHFHQAQQANLGIN